MKGFNEHQYADEALVAGDRAIVKHILNKVEDVIYSHQGLTYGGLLTSKNIKLEEFVNCIKSVLKLKEFLSDHFKIKLRINDRYLGTSLLR